MKIYYLYDALCGWCYGFSPVFQEFYEEFLPDYSFEVISGGMIQGDRIGPIGEVASYIGDAYKQVEERTGVQFGVNFLDGTLKKGTAIFTSVPPARALTAMKQLQPDSQVPFAGALQKAIYFDGMEPEDMEGYIRLAGDFGVDATDYSRLLNAEDNAYAAREEFMFTQQLGVQGFPMVVLKNDHDQYYLVSSGYVPGDVLRDHFRMAVKAAKGEVV